MRFDQQGHIVWTPSALYQMALDSPRRLVNAYAKWERGEPVNPASVRKIRNLQRLLRGLKRVVVRADSILPWLQKPNPAFGGRMPVQLLEAGEYEPLERM